MRCVRCALTALLQALTALIHTLTALIHTLTARFGTDYCAYGTLIAGGRCGDSSAAPLGHIAPCHAGVYAVVAADARRATALCERVALEHDFAHVSELTMPPVDLMVLQLATCDMKPATLFDVTQHARHTHTQSGTRGSGPVCPPVQHSLADSFSRPQLVRTSPAARQR
jgi:hypothetical protein